MKICTNWKNTVSLWLRLIKNERKHVVIGIILWQAVWYLQLSDAIISRCSSLNVSLELAWLKSVKHLQVGFVLWHQKCDRFHFGPFELFEWCVILSSLQNRLMCCICLFPFIFCIFVTTYAPFETRKKKTLFKMKNQMLLYIMHSLLLALVHLIILYKYFKNKRYFYFYCCFICLFIHNMYHKISLHLLFICFCFCDYLSLSLFVIVPSSSTYINVLLIHLCVPSIFQCNFVNILIKPMCFFSDCFKWLLFSFKI